MSLTIPLQSLLDQTRFDDSSPPFADATWLIAAADHGGFTSTFPAGSLSQNGLTHLTCDLLLDGFLSSAFLLLLHEGLTAEGPAFGLIFGLLGQCQARLSLPLSATDQSQWSFPRRGALLKPLAWGDRVDLAKVERISLHVIYRGEPKVRWAMTPISVVAGLPPELTDPILPKGKLLDEFGQTTSRDWPGKTRSAEELKSRINEQLSESANTSLIAGASKWGGDGTQKLNHGTGFFSVQYAGNRWWLVDPDGHAFWSAGMNCVRPDAHTAITGLEGALTWLPPQKGDYAPAFADRLPENAGRGFDYLTANLIKALGPKEWKANGQAIAMSQLRRIGINTVGNWSDFRAASAAQFPYVRPLEWIPTHAPCVFRDLPDVFHPGFQEDALAFAAALKETAHDPALIGFFLMNEPTWAFARLSPAAGMLFVTDECHARDRLADHLRAQYRTDLALASTWNMPGVTFGAVASGKWNRRLSPAAELDLQTFSTIWVTRYFEALSAACKAVDPNHLNLGARYYKVPPEWALQGMKSFDVFSINCYRPRVPADALAHIGKVTGRPTLIGEWHFGSKDVGLPAGGMMQVATQEDRGKAYRVYLENAAAIPWCVGVHYFTLYDEATLGRFDGEMFNIGFLDTCNHPYEPLCKAARRSHERMYTVAKAQIQPYADAPEYLPSLSGAE